MLHPQHKEYFEELNRSTAVDLKDWFDKNFEFTAEDLNKDKNLPLEILTLCYDYTPKPLAYWNLHASYGSIPPNSRHSTLTTELMEYVDFKCISDTKELLYYNSNEGIWINEGEDIVKAFCYALNDPMKENIAKDGIYRLKGLMKNYARRKNFDPKHLLAVENGVIDINDSSYHPHDKKYNITRKMPVIYDPKATSENIDEFMSQIVDEDNLELLQDIVGYTLYADHIFHKFFIMLGSGANGKSTFLNMISIFLGQENVSNVFLNDLADTPYHAATLHGKMANIVADLPAIPIKNTAVLKALTGNDWIQVRKIYGHPFSFQNAAKMIYSCNQLPKMLTDDSYALWRRIVLIDFPKKFQGDKRDEKMLDKLTTPEEMSGLLNLALVALRRLLKRGRFEKDDETNIKKTKDSYLMRTDSTRSFISNVLELNAGVSELKSNIDTAYQNWCVLNKDVNSIFDSQNVFTRRLKEHAFGVSIVQWTVNGVRDRYWKNLKIKDHWRFIIKAAG